jgi:hypothetical protein
MTAKLQAFQRNYTALSRLRLPFTPTIGPGSYPRPNIMTTSALTAPNPIVSVDRRRNIFRPFCGAVLGVAIVASADFALAQLTHVGSLPAAAKEFAQRSALLAQAGDRDGAVEASRKAVDVYRRLVHGSAVHYEPGLAASLHALALRLSEADDTAGARAAIEEAIVMRRCLARYGARYAEGLAMSLALLASIETAAAPESVNTADAVR